MKLVWTVSFDSKESIYGIEGQGETPQDALASLRRLTDDYLSSSRRRQVEAEEKIAEWQQRVDLLGSMGIKP